MVSEEHALNQYGLITRERAEKFDLLGQLILNQREAIILCGIHGVGKTTLLKTFKKQRENIWIICLLQGIKTLSFEQIQIQLISAIQRHNPELAKHNLESALHFCEQQQRQAVLMIDDASALSAGLITTLTEYALHNPVLRIVFAFSREQLYQKNLTDRAVDDCYFMELPALTKLQTAVFLQDLSVSPSDDVKSNLLRNNDKSLNKFYQRTAGIPGKILTEFPALVTVEQEKNYPSLLSIAFVAVVAIGAAVFHAYQSNHNADLASVSGSSHSLPLKPVRAIVKQDIHIILAKQNNKVVASEGIQQSIKTTELQENKPLTQQDADEKWILQQMAGKYTLQLMALSKRQALLNIVKKHPNLESALKILRVKNRNQEKYVLLYGSFPDTKTAYAAVSSLPIEFKQAWPRQFNLLQQEVKKRTVLSLKPTQLPSK